MYHISLASNSNLKMGTIQWSFFPLFSLFQIVAKEREVSEWKEKYEESRREVMEMRWVINLITLSKGLISAFG